MFELLLRRHQDAVYSLCLRWLVEPRLAAEATQAAFVELSDLLKRSNTPPRVLIVRLAVGECERRGKDRKLERARPAEGEEARLRAALSELESRELAVLLLRDLGDLDLDEIAEVLDLSRGSARARLQRARLRLGHSLDNQLDV